MPLTTAKLIIFILLWSLSTAWATAKTDLTMGLGMETRFQREVNPDYTSARFSGQLYAQVQQWPWVLALELTPTERSSTSSGSLRVQSEVIVLGFWGRYELLTSQRQWTAFAGLGAGMNFDRVTTDFAGESDARTSRRGFAGAGLGLGGILWKRLSLEAEGRAVSLEEREDPIFSLVLRAGILAL